MKLLLIGLLTCGAALAQPGGFFAWWDSPVVRDLNLTNDQQSQIRATVREYRTRVIDARAAMEKSDGELEDILDAERVDQKKANDAVERLATARAEMTRVFSQMSVKLRGFLTAQQWQELQKRRPRPGHGPEMVRPGMPGRGPGPQPRQEPRDFE